MNMIFSLLWFIIIFSVVVVSHEFGHFIVAKANGIRVKEFMVGFGPSIFKFKKGETVYKINILPLGGACVYDGMDEIEDSEEDKEEVQGQIKDRSKFLNASPWAKLATLLAGPLFNFILGFIVAFIMVNMIIIREPVVTDVIEGGAAEAAGLQAGDRILALNGGKIYLYDEISVFTSYYHGGEVSVTYQRGEEIGEVTLTPYFDEEHGRYLIGITNDTFVEELHGFDAFKFTWYEMRYNVLMVWKGLGALITGNINRENVAGPVGMVNMVGDIIEETSPYGWQTVLVNMLNLTLLLTVNLGVFNMLPVPALDGGRILFALVEIVRGKPVPPKKEAYVHLAGMVLLLIIVVAVFFNDIHNIFN
ncbi:MAG: site-2 protease family protein [Lachnospiraceae bacterium]|nr:site-2 protease family protein [Lachnospiraceae bacterium]